MSKRVGIMQPYFFPYIGYWQIMKAVDNRAAMIANIVEVDGSICIIPPIFRSTLYFRPAFFIVFVEVVDFIRCMVFFVPSRLQVYVHALSMTFIYLLYIFFDRI